MTLDRPIRWTRRALLIAAVLALGAWLLAPPFEADLDRTTSLRLRDDGVLELRLWGAPRAVQEADPLHHPGPDSRGGHLWGVAAACLAGAGALALAELRRHRRAHAPGSTAK